MHKSINNLNLIKENLKLKVKDYDKTKIIAVSKTFPLEVIMPLIDHARGKKSRISRVALHIGLDELNSKLPPLAGIIAIQSLIC